MPKNTQKNISEEITTDDALNTLETEETAVEPVEGEKHVPTEDEIEDALMKERKEAFAKAINPKIATLIQKADEVTRLAQNPARYPNIVTQDIVDSMGEVLDDTKRKIIAALETLRDYKPVNGNKVNLREKPAFSIFG